MKQVQNEPISADIAFVGKDIRYVQGQVESGGNTLFYTSHVYGTNDVVAAAWNINGEPFRMNILSPFSEKLPQNLPSLKLYRNKKRLLERSIGIQLQQVTVLDSLDHAIPLQSCYGLQPYLNYNLDEYTRFNTMTETFVEFVRSVIIRKVNGKRRLRVLKEGEKRFNIGNTLVLLDGVPIHDHEDILKYKNFISSGGVTLSGGEPLLQPEFCQALISLCHSAGIHCAVDTAGSIPLDFCRQAVDAADLLLLDIKALDPTLCQELTGQDNQNALALLEYCEAAQKAVWIRHVLVPGLTLRRELLENLAEFLSGFSCVEQVELLPFHKMGEYKWEALNLRSPLSGTREPTKAEVAAAKKIFQSRGLSIH